MDEMRRLIVTEQTLAVLERRLETEQGGSKMIGEKAIEEKRDKQVARELRALEGEIAAIEMQIADMTSALEAVLTPAEVPEPALGEMQVPSDLVPLAAYIAGLRRRANMISERVASMTVRLEV